MAGTFNLKAAVWAGLIAGAVFMMLEMLLVGTIGGGSPWAPPRMIAAIGMGEGVLPPPATFDLGIMLVAMLIHFALAVILGLFFALIVARWDMGLIATAAVGAAFGIAVYLVAFYGFTALFPWFAMARNGISLFAHAMFGLALGWSYYVLARPRPVAAR